MMKRFERQAAGPLWVVDAVAAILMALALSAGAGALSRDDERQLLIAAVGLVVAALFRSVIHIVATDAGEAAAVSARNGWRRRVYRQVLVKAPSSRLMLGETVADAVDRIEDLGGFHARFLPLRRAALISPLLIAVAVSFGSWVAGLIMFLTLLPFGLGMALAGTAAARAAARQLDALSRLSGLFVDRIRALPVIAGFGAQDRVSRHLSEATREVAVRTVEVLKVAFVSSAIIEFFAALSIALVALYCGFNLLSVLPFPSPETLTLEEALFVLLLAPEFYLPMRRLAAAYHDKQLGEAATERLQLIAPAPVSSASFAFHSPPDLRFDHVIVDYGETVIGPFSFDVQSGTSLAISGHTGIGKSSLLHALMGMAPVGGGKILIDGREAADCAIAGHVGWAGQTVAFIPGTIADNIRLARADASDAEVEAAACRAGLGPLLAARGEGMALVLDHRGSGLSGGERRRIAIARVLLKDAPLWLLDEPTADLDAQSAEDISDILVSAARERTVLIVTHSEDLAARADQQMVLS